MSGHLTKLSRRFPLPLCLLFSACGGGGGSHIAAIPPPPAAPAPTTPAPAPTPPINPTADSPLARPGNYEVIGSVAGVPPNGLAAPGAFKLTASKSAADQPFTYKLDGPAGFLPGGVTSVEYAPSSFTGGSGSGGSYGRTLSFDAEKNVSTFFSFDFGYSYVSIGEWGWNFVHPDGGTADGGYGKLLFVAGDRTPESGIPASGTATYDARSRDLKNANFTAGIPFTLTADFGQRLMSTRIDQDYRYDPSGDVLDYPAPGIHVAGSAPFSGGVFNIPLSGTANYTGGYPLNTPETPPTQQVTGSMNGAFFGPHAEQVGGVFFLNRSNGTQLTQDAFVGRQH